MADVAVPRPVPLPAVPVSTSPETLQVSQQTDEKLQTDQPQAADTQLTAQGLQRAQPEAAAGSENFCAASNFRRAAMQAWAQAAKKLHQWILSQKITHYRFSTKIMVFVCSIYGFFKS